MNNLFLKVFFLVLLVTVAGCHTTYDLDMDRINLNENFNPNKVDNSLYIIFSEKPGTASASLSSMVPSGGLFIPIGGSGSLNVDPIAKDMAKEVFSLKFKNVTFIEPTKENYHRLVIRAWASTESMNGGHTASIATELYDINSQLLYKGKAENEVNYWRYAQEGPMRRAFYLSYHEVLRNIECTLNKNCLTKLSN